MLIHLFSRDFAGNVKYSTLCPSRMDSPSAARRAIPTRRGVSGDGKIGKEGIVSPFVSPRIIRLILNVKRKRGEGKETMPERRDTIVNS